MTSAANVLEITQIQEPDVQGAEIAKKWYMWNMLRQNWVAETTELRKYISATDPTKTSNSKLPWKNKTTIPKLCQIRDNLRANYVASIFPNKKKWLRWEGASRDANTLKKRGAITARSMQWTQQKSYKLEMAKCIDDYVDYGNAFGMAVWKDERVDVTDRGKPGKYGYVGPGFRRISPLDIVMNPIADSWDDTPVIVRSLVTRGELEDQLMKMSGDDSTIAKKMLAYMDNYRMQLLGFGGELVVKDDYLNVDGFTNYRLYLQSNYTEILTFYGDIYDQTNKVFKKNQIITVADRHRVIHQMDNPSILGKKPINHIGWRTRQDNLWAMGPLSNLVGMQYRLDHIENLKADIWDLTAFPPLKIKGYVEDFEWGPFSRITVDEDGDVELLKPEWNVLTANSEMMQLMDLMELMAGSPKEAMGFRTPGEKTKYEVQRLENAAARIFQARTYAFEENFEERVLNDMLELDRRFADSNILASYFDDDTKITVFMDLTPDDISGEGRIIPYAARHFSEQAELVQNLTSFFASPIGGDPGIKAHWSTIKLSKLFEDIFDVQGGNIVQPYIRMAEEADAQRFAQALQAQVLMEGLTPTGLTPDDTIQPNLTSGNGPGGAGGMSPVGSPLDQPVPNSALNGGPTGPPLTHSLATPTMPLPGPTDQGKATPPMQNGGGFPPGNRL